MKQIHGGLRKLPKDNRDVKFGAVFGLHDLVDLPDEFTVAEPLEMLDQGETDTCAGHASIEVSEDQEGVPLDPLYQFAKAKQIEGDWTTWGCDLRVMAKSFTKYGSLDKAFAPYSIMNNPREIWANWANYDKKLDDMAAIHKKESFAFVHGPHDFFDDCRLTMYRNVDKKQTIFTGTMWCEEWTLSPNGVITDPGTPGFGHAVKFYGWTQIGGETYMKVQLSNGQDIGNKGLFYFSRKVINQCFADFGAIVFTDIPSDKLMQYHKYGINVDDSQATKILKVLTYLLTLGLITLKQ